MDNLLVVMFMPGSPIPEIAKRSGYPIRPPESDTDVPSMWCTAVEPEWGQFLVLTPAEGDPPQPQGPGPKAQVVVPMAHVLAVLHTGVKRGIGFAQARPSSPPAG